MDTGIVGFLTLLALFAVGGLWFRSRQARIDRAVKDEGFEPVAEIPGEAAGHLERVVGARLQRTHCRLSSDEGQVTWLVEMLSDAQEASGAFAVLVKGVPASTSLPPFLALAFSGARPSGWLGRVGRRLSELGSDALSSLHRLTDERTLLFEGSDGFVVWAGEPGDVSVSVPSGVREFLQGTPAGLVQGLAVVDGFAMVWSEWRDVVELIQQDLEIAHALGIGR